MDMNNCVEFVALTKEEVEEMIAKAALAGASVAAETLEKAHQKEQKEMKDRRLHNTRLLLRNYRMLKESCSKAVYQKEHSEKTTEEVIEELMSMKASDGVIVNSIKESAERTGIIISHVDRMFPAWAVLPFLFMIVSGLLSTVDSNLCAASSLVTDMSGGKELKKTKWAMIALLGVGILIANIPGMTVTHLFLFYGTLRASTLLPTVMTLNYQCDSRCASPGKEVLICVNPRAK